MRVDLNKTSFTQIFKNNKFSFIVHSLLNLLTSLCEENVDGKYKMYLWIFNHIKYFLYDPAPF